MFLKRMLCLVGYSLKNNHLIKMAKYRLTKNPKKSVNCEVLQENLNGYIVRFDNGMIKNVNKKNVYAFDRIDEAVINEGFIDDAKDVVSKFGKKVKNVYNRVKSAFGALFLKIKNRIYFQDKQGSIISANHPINTMEYAKQNNIGYIPSEATMSLCNEAGITPVTTNYVFDKDGYNGSASYNVSGVNESVYDRSLISVINEVQLSYPEHKDRKTGKPTPRRKYMTLESEGFNDIVDWDLNKISRYLTGLYEGKIEKSYDTEGASKMPIVFGAPGIGKTTIIKSIKNRVKPFKNELGEPLGSPTVITINATAVNSDSFTLPVSVKKSIERAIISGNDVKTAEYKNGDKNGKHGAFEIGSAVKDLPKSWLPVYDRLDENGQDKSETEILKANAIANGGKIVIDENGNEKIVNGPGGLFFIDEFTRMHMEGMDALMNVCAGGEIGQGLMFGDRWLVCGASNRPVDVSDVAFQQGYEYEMANIDRIDMMNYVPNPADWFAWARSTNSRTKKANVLPEIVDFVENSVIEKGEKDYMGYYYFSINIADDMKDKRGSFDAPRCTPRAWEVASNQIKSQMGIGFDSITDYLTQLDAVEQSDEITYLSEILQKGVGSFVANEFKNYLKSIVKTLTYDDLKDIMKNGYKYYLSNPSSNQDIYDYLLGVQTSSPADFPGIFKNSFIGMIKEYMLEEKNSGNKWYMKYPDILHEEDAIKVMELVYYIVTKGLTDFSAKSNIIDTIVYHLRSVGVNSSSGNNVSHPAFVKFVDQIKKKLS